jgi:L-ascorbate metabolism protein UlaG (beta-lactamase superfamily)
MKKRSRKMTSLFFGSLLIFLTIIVITACGRAKFGRLPQGERLARLQTSSNYQQTGFVNTVPTQIVLNDQGFLSILWRNFWRSAERQRPNDPLPVVKTDLKSLDRERDLVIWLGHSSFYLQLAGQRILVDPVLSSNAAPFWFLNKSFEGTNLYTADDFPAIDFLLITHDHWDHLDYQTAIDLEPKIARVITPLGVGEHFELWGYPKEKLWEGDWNDQFNFENELMVFILPARHYSGRLLTRNKTLWAGFALQTPKRKIYLSGDSGYGPHFAELAKSFAGFDLVSIEGGQYDPLWPYIHMTPEEAVKAAKEVGARSLVPCHIGKFDIANHAWDEPFKRFVQASQANGVRLLTPRIGEPIILDDQTRSFTKWWEGVN